MAHVGQELALDLVGMFGMSLLGFEPDSLHLQQLAPAGLPIQVARVLPLMKRVQNPAGRPPTSPSQYRGPAEAQRTDA